MRAIVRLPRCLRRQSTRSKGPVRTPSWTRRKQSWPALGGGAVFNTRMVKEVDDMRKKLASRHLRIFG